MNPELEQFADLQVIPERPHLPNERGGRPVNRQRKQLVRAHAVTEILQVGHDISGDPVQRHGEHFPVGEIVVPETRHAGAESGVLGERVIAPPPTPTRLALEDDRACIASQLESHSGAAIALEHARAEPHEIFEIHAETRLRTAARPRVQLQVDPAAPGREISLPLTPVLGGGGSTQCGETPGANAEGK